MSIVTLPRRVESRPRTRPATIVPSHRRRRLSVLGRWRARSTTTKVSVIALLTLMALLAGNSYVAQRQVEIHRLQTALLQDQSNYALQVAQLTNAAAPAKVAEQAGHLHLVVPSLVTQISAVPLTVVLPQLHLVGYYTMQSRTYQ